MLKRMFATLVLYSGLATSALAAEFTWFTDVQGREGWIEFAAETVSFQNRIHVFPRIGGPGDVTGAPRIEDRSDGGTRQGRCGATSVARRSINSSCSFRCIV